VYKSESRILVKPVRVAFLIDSSRSFVYDAIKKGEIPSVRIAGVLRVPLAAVERLIAERLEKGGNHDEAA